MTPGDLILQNLFGIIASVIASVLGYLAVRILRSIRQSTERTEQHASDTVAKVSQLDLISTSSWRQEIERSVAALAENKSDGLAWQATLDRRLLRVERFISQLDAFAHDRAPMPSLDDTVQPSAATTEGSPHGQQ